jgi:hypothetical protein
MALGLPDRDTPGAGRAASIAELPRMTQSDVVLSSPRSHRAGKIAER